MWKNRKALDKHVSTLFAVGTSQVFKIGDIQTKNWNYFIIRDQMVSLSSLLVCILGNCLPLVGVTTQTVSNFNIGNEKNTLLKPIPYSTGS